MLITRRPTRRTRVVMGRLRPIDLMPSLVCWLEPDLGGLTISSSIKPEADVTTNWTRLNVQAATLTDDPMGGNAARRNLETAVLGYHGAWRNLTIDNLVTNFPTEFRGWMRAVNGRNLGILDGSDGTPTMVISGSTGATLAATGTTPVVVSGINSWYYIKAYAASTWVPAASNLLCCSADGTTMATVAGDITKGVDLYDLDLVQHRASALVDRSPNAYNWVQATAANQAGVQKSDGTSPGSYLWPGHNCLWYPNDSSRYLTCSTAGLLNYFNGANTFIGRIRMLSAPTLSLILWGCGGAQPWSYGINSALQPYINANGTLLTSATAVSTASANSLAYAFDPSTGAGSIWINGSVVASSPSIGGALVVGATLAITNMKCSGFLAEGMSSQFMTTGQVQTVSNAFIV